MKDELLTLADSDLNRRQIETILERTPKKYQYIRPGKGGQNFTYAPIGYFIKKLNRVFGFAGWDFEILEQGVLEDNIWVKGKLTVKDSKGHTITKMQFGGTEIKRMKSDNKPLSIGNDFKIAASDCLKKCAALIGIASDVYYANEYQELSMNEIKELPEPNKKDKK